MGAGIIEAFASSVFALLTLLGLLGLVAMFLPERLLGGRLSIQRWSVHQTSALIIPLMRASGALGAIFAGRDAVFSWSSPASWASPRPLAILCWLTWEFAAAIAVIRAKRRQSVEEGRVAVLTRSVAEIGAERDELRSQTRFLNRLLMALRHTVLDKSHRLRKQVTSARGGPTIPRLRDALDPQKQVYLTLEHMGGFLREFIPAPEDAREQNFRIGLYVARGGRLEPEASWDVSMRRDVAFRSFREHRDRFAIDSPNPSCAVRCLKEEIVLVPDCESIPGFYLHDEQRAYLKSLLAYRIIPYGRADTQGAAVVVVDTNVPGYFQEKDRRLLRVFMEEFASRLDLAALFQQALEPSEPHA